MYYGHGGPGMWYGIIGFIVMLIFFALIIGLGIYIYRRPFGHVHGNGHESARHSSNARAILDERFARGEIDVEEYNLRRDALKREE